MQSHTSGSAEEMMKKWYCWPVVVSGLLLAGQTAFAAQVGLADWCFNVNGNFSASNACNGGGGPSIGSVNIVSGQTTPWDTTLEDGINNNGLGAVTITLGAGAMQFLAFYADYDVDYNTFGSFDDSATTSGALGAGWSYEANDPNTSSIGSDIATFSNASPFSDTNNVGTASGPPAQCCDVAFALGIGGINVNSGGSATVKFTVANTAPATGFYIKQTNADTQDSIFLSATVTVTNPGSSTPEPGTFALGLGVVCVALGVVRRRRSSR
jgi:uncharacterized protein (TIGR03382 family)